MTRMSKILRIFLVGVLLVSVFITTGCGEEQRYREGKQQVESMLAEIEKIEALEKNRKQYDSIREKAWMKLEELERYTIEDKKLAYDYKKLKEKYGQVTEGWVLKQMHNECPKTFDPEKTVVFESVWY